MDEKQLVICNKADKNICPPCFHKKPHDPNAFPGSCERKCHIIRGAKCVEYRKPLKKRRTKMNRILIWWVEDDDYVYEELQKQITKEMSNKKVKIERFKNLRFLNEKVGSPNLIIVDVAGMFGGAINMALAPLSYYSIIFASVVEKHPGAIYGVYSIVGWWASGLIAEVKELAKESVLEEVFVHLNGKEPETAWGESSLTLKKFLKKYIISNNSKENQDE